MSAPPVTTEPAALTWLQGLPPDLHTMAERLFEAAIAEGHADPQQICRQVWLVLRDHIPQAQADGDEAQAARLLQIRNRLNEARDEAIVFAAAYLERTGEATRVDDLVCRLSDRNASWASEEEFEGALAEHFRRARCVVHRQAWCNVYCDTSQKNGDRRRADLHVQLPEPIEGWLSCFVVELKLDDGSTGDIRTGAKQAIAYMRGFDWRQEGGRHDGSRLPRPDFSFFTTPRVLSVGNHETGERDWHYLERDLWDNGCALLTWHRYGEKPGTVFRYLEKGHSLTGRRS